MTRPDEIDLEALAVVVEASALVPADSRVVALASGGPDSTALIAALVGYLGAERVLGLHLDYRLRDDSGEDRAAFLETCDLLGVESRVIEPDLSSDSGNTQALARDARYSEAERLRAESGCDLIATGHTRTDLVETLIYRLAVSPGSRALLGLPERQGSVVRPLLSVPRSDARRMAEAAGLPFRDDPTNSQPLYARNRIRNEVLPVLDEIGHGRIEQTIAETRADLAEQAEALERVAREAIDPYLAAPLTGSGVAIPAEALAPLHPAVRRIALRLAAERLTAGVPVAMGRDRAIEILRVARDPEGGTVELGSGLEARLEFGQILFVSAADASATPDPQPLEIPGSCRLGDWEVRAELASTSQRAEGPEVAVCSRNRLGESRLTVRTWSDGDRIAPIGLDGTKSLADLFADRRIPRSLRHRLPVVSDPAGRVVWVAGVAVSREFAADPADPAPALISASIRTSGAGSGA